MKPSLKRFAVASAVLLAAGGLCGAAGICVNTSKSIPLGIYMTSKQQPGKGSYVLFCPPQNAVFAEARRRGYLAAGFCPGGYGYLMKMVCGTDGDAVMIKESGVSVNGALLAFSRPIEHDASGRPLARFQPAIFTLRSSEILLMSNVSGTSFDARYFGPVDRSQIRTVIVPVLTW